MGSASQPMLVVKYNRSLLRKRRSYKEIRESYIGYTAETQLEFKQLTEFEKKKIKDKIIAQAKKDKIQNIKASIASILVLIFMIYGIYLLFS